VGLGVVFSHYVNSLYVPSSPTVAELAIIPSSYLSDCGRGRETNYFDDAYGRKFEN
jgi:hypothetical protein